MEYVEFVIGMLVQVDFLLYLMQLDYYLYYAKKSIQWIFCVESYPLM